MNTNTNYDNPFKILSVIKNRWLLILVTMGLITSVGTWLIWEAARIYSATAVLIVHSQQKNYIDIQSLQTVERINATIAQMIGYKSLISSVREASNIHTGKITGRAVQGTELIEITGSDNTPENAKNLANAAANALIQKVNQLQNEKNLGITIEIFEHAEKPPIPTSMSKKIQVVGLFIFSIFAALVIAGFKDNIDKRVAEEDIQNTLNLALIGKTPRFRSKGGQRIRSRDSFKQLQSTLQFMKLREPLNAIAFTGTRPGEGKSSTVANIALAFQNVGQDVIVADLDLRKPSMHHVFNIPNNTKNGLANVVTATGTFPEPSRTEYPHISVYPAGVISPEASTRVYQSPRLRELIEKSADKWLLVDLPPLMLVPGAANAAALFSNAIFVMERKHTKVRDAMECLNLLKQANVNVLGAILTKLPNHGRGYYKYY